MRTVYQCAYLRMQKAGLGQSLNCLIEATILLYYTQVCYIVYCIISCAHAPFTSQSILDWSDHGAPVHTGCYERGVTAF